MDDTAMNTDDRSRAIRHDIAQTREEMAETIDAIQDKLRPAAIVANATDRVKAATTQKVRAMAETAGDTAHNVMNRTREGADGLLDTLRDNPYPTALIGIGAAWLMMNASKGSRSQAGFRKYRNDPREYGAQYSGSSAYRQSAQGDTLTSRASEYAGQTSDAVVRAGRQAQNRLQRMMYENPLLVGAGALMLGAAFGLAVPETDRENEMMGELRDSVIERAQQMAGDAATKVQDTAHQVADAAANVVQSVSSEPKQA
jgi:ElaB/YqjD/DUF883 family membrane-anchored ribosome-binding protein